MSKIGELDQSWTLIQHFSTILKICVLGFSETILDNTHINELLKETVGGFKENFYQGLNGSVLDLRLTLEFFSKFVDKVFLTSYLMVNTKKWVKVTVCGLLREINILLKVGCFIFSVFSSITNRGSLYFVLVFVAFHFFSPHP